MFFEKVLTGGSGPIDVVPAETGAGEAVQTVKADAQTGHDDK
jgi:hypothetical protein